MHYIDTTRRHIVLRPRTAHAGFTLIELMIALGIIAILAGVAVPQYREYATRSRLAHGIGTLKELRARMEQRYADNRTYANAGGNGCAIADFTDPESGFAFTCVLAGAGQAFTWTATGSGRTAGFGYTVDEAGVESTTAAAAGWTSATLPVNRFVLRKGG